MLDLQRGPAHAAAALASEGARLTHLSPPRSSPSPAALRALRRASLGLTVAAIAIGVVAIAGWLAGFRYAATWLPSLSPIRPNAALLAAALGIGLLLAQRPGRARLVARAIALGSLALAATSGAEWLLGRDLGLDNLFWPGPLEGPRELAAERMSLGTAVLFASLAVAILVRANERLLAWLVEPAAAVSSLLATFALISIGLGADSDIAFAGSPVSLPGAVAAACLAVATLTSRPEHRIVQELLDPGPAGRATRAILPAVAAFPIVGFVVMRGFEAGWMSASITAVTAVVFGIAYSGFLLSRAAHKVSELDRQVVAARDVRDRFFDLTGEIVTIIGADGRIRYASAAVRSALGYEPEEIVGRSYADFFPEEERERRATTFAHLIGTDEGRRHVERRVRHRDGSWRWIEWATNRDPASGSLYAVGQDVSERRKQRIARELLAAVIEQSNETVILTDAEGTVVYVNSAFERTSGRSSADVVGLSARSLGHGPQKPAIQVEIGRAMTLGKSWRGEWTEARSDGSTHTEAVGIAPVHDADGRISNWVYTGLDVTDHRAAQAALEREVRERAEVIAALGRIDLSGPLDDAAAGVCEELVLLPGVDYAVLVAFGKRQSQVVASLGLDDALLAAGAIIPDEATERLRTRAEHGPWTNVVPRNVRRSTFDPLAAAGLRVLASAPIRNGADVVGVIRIGTRREGRNEALIRLLPALSEFAAAAGGALGPALAARTADETVRATVRGWIDDVAFSTVFQPIVGLASEVTLGYEALTRFADGTRPDQAFAEARAAGLGFELEIATLREALRSSADLPAGLLLDLNVSPALLLHGTCLTEALAGRDRPIVLEITEHDRIDDYGAVREAIRALGPDIRLAVDDAGAGAANMVHLVELRPDFVKLDISLVRGINIDPTRQALVVGLRHFATAARCRLVAEGIETAAEATTLAAFGIEYGQGYWLGRPAPASTLAEIAAGPALGLPGPVPRHPRRDPPRVVQSVDDVIRVAADEGPRDGRAHDRGVRAGPRPVVGGVRGR
jgi:PAS domain S-box-containing protein